MKSHRLEPRPNPDELSGILISAAGRVELPVRIIPRARRTQLGGIRNGALVIRVAAPPVEGTANEVLLAFVAEAVNVTRSRVRLVSGDRSRNKRLAISGLTVDDLESRLNALLEKHT